MRELNILVSEIFERSNPEGAKLWRFTDITLKQFNLSQAYPPEEIIAIAYERTVKAIQAEKQIKTASIIPWFKATVFNIVRELRRFRDKENSNRKDILEEKIADITGLQEDIFREANSSSLKYEMLVRYIKTLPPLDQELIRMRGEQALPWAKIANNLSEKNFVVTSEQALRKRYSRLRIGLRHQLISNE